MPHYDQPQRSKITGNKALFAASHA